MWESELNSDNQSLVKSNIEIMPGFIVWENMISLKKFKFPQK